MSAPINLADRIELRRFVGRELLLWLWMESELFEATLSTKQHGAFGLWLEGRLVLLADRRESTVIKGDAPGLHREAKESLLRGKTPERAGLHLSFGYYDCTLTLRGDSLSFAGLTPPKREKEEVALRVDAPPPRARKRATETAGDEHDAFYERMHFARDVEALIGALYRDFLALRLAPVWTSTVMPALEAWVAGEEVDTKSYAAARDRALAKPSKLPPQAPAAEARSARKKPAAR